MTNKELAERAHQALAEFGRLTPDEQAKRLVAAGTINKYGEALMDPPLYKLCAAAVAMGYALRRLPNPGDFQTNGRPLSGADDELTEAFISLEKNLRIRGDTADDRIKSLGFTGGPAWRRRVIAKIIRGQALAQAKKVDEALSWFGQAAWEYRDALPGNRWLEGEIEKIWPLRLADDQSLDNWVC